MARVEEMLEAEQVMVRLIARYPAAQAGDIEERVRVIHKRFTSCKVRNFVPLLVEKAAVQEITDSAASPVSRLAGP
ncbi:hypothetical protein IA539_21745 [Gordonia sp. zg691]|nr:hypothetical protein [Gordonia jinghuaiqii]